MFKWQTKKSNFRRFLKMKYNFVFYGIGFLSLMLVNIIANNLEKDKNYQYLTTQRCLEIQKLNNGDLKKCL